MESNSTNERLRTRFLFQDEHDSTVLRYVSVEHPSPETRALTCSQVACFLKNDA